MAIVAMNKSQQPAIWSDDLKTTTAAAQPSMSIAVALRVGQSRVGLQGAEPLFGDWQAVFKIETFFNPQSGEISDAQKSMVQNNGRSLATQTVNLNSSVSGQTFQTAIAGCSSKTFGTMTQRSACATSSNARTYP
jgi:predicted porin